MHLWYTVNEIGVLQEMTMYTAKVSAKGWVIIPEPLREKYSLREGTQVRMVDYDGVLALVPLPVDPVEALHGMLEGEPSLTEELLTGRAQDRAREGI
jgi:AbrB family looped-hinge helix DNA binding protein